MFNERINELYLGAVARFMTAAAKALGAYGALKERETADPGAYPAAAIQRFRENLDAMVDACHYYEKIDTIKAVIAQIDAEG
jgi:hypothetical protein